MGGVAFSVAVESCVSTVLFALMNAWPTRPKAPCREAVLLCAAVRNGSIKKVQQLLAARRKKELYALDRALDTACDHRHLAIVELLLQAGADPNAGPFLYLMAEDNDCDIAALLIQHGANVHAHNEAALIAAVDNGDAAMTALLLNNGANAQHNRSHALAVASSAGNREIFDLLYPHSNVDICWQEMQKNGCSNEERWLLEERVREEKAQQQRVVLGTALGGLGSAKLSQKKM